MTVATAKMELALALEEAARRQRHRLRQRYFPDTGPLRRALYPKHLEFFAAGRSHRTRLLCAANRIGKTEGAGGYELSYHLTGGYPAWWEGRRFDHPVRTWAAGDTAKTTRDILQLKLLGEPGAFGTGLIPGAALLDTKPKAGLPDAVEIVRVRHASGGTSTLLFKSYDQKREAFQGTEQDVILLDEEPPLAIYTECLLRTTPITGAVTPRDGCLMLTFTPLSGMSDTVLQFLPDGQMPEGPQTGSQYVVQAGWDDVPHLSAATKAEMLAAMPAYQRDARTRGLPLLGAGAIFPVEEASWLVDDFPIPPHWKQAYGLDVGWNRTAAVWGAYDGDTDCWTLWKEHYVAETQPTLHAAAIRAPGDWIPGCIDPAARGRSQDDGEAMLDLYTDLGLHLEPADNAVEAGLYQVWERLSTGRLKVCRSLSNWRKEMKLYRRDDKGHIVKKQDHLMDATRYLIMSGRAIAKQVPVVKPPREPRLGGGKGSWMS
jgi:phage terminase large subunit-like protein